MDKVLWHSAHDRPIVWLATIEWLMLAHHFGVRGYGLRVRTIGI